MPAMTEQRRTKVEEQQHDQLVGRYFIVRDNKGRPIKAGRIRSRTLNSDMYDVTVYVAGESPHGEVISAARMETERWEFFIGEENWRRAYSTNSK
jgi:hypothetical protein